jgi:hypothetical protein
MSEHQKEHCQQTGLDGSRRTWGAIGSTWKRRDTAGSAHRADGCTRILVRTAGRTRDTAARAGVRLEGLQRRHMKRERSSQLQT